MASSSVVFAAPAPSDELAEVRARVYQSGRALTAPSRSSASAVVAGFLRARGGSDATVGSLRATEARQGLITHVRYEQYVGGLRVHGAYAKAAVNEQGELIHLIDGTSQVGAVASARVSESDAVGAALRNLYPELRDTQPAEQARDGNTVSFAGGAFFHRGPTVERVAYAAASGALRTGFLVETWTAKTNQLTHTLVSGEGRVLSSESRTANDRYNVFTNDPMKTPQAIVAGPGTGNLESPIGWLNSSGLTTRLIAGNNVRAYLDVDANNAPDSGGTSVTNGDFLTVANQSVAPTTDANRNVTVQNLFYLNNVIHDRLYRHGFNEAALNFQENNFSKGGLGSDSVDAEAQDGSGTDNANFSTPADGSNPRMQMYLWTGVGTHQVYVQTPTSIAGTYVAQGDGEFGPALTTTGISGDIVLVNDGVGTTSDGCESIPSGSLTGKIALMDRGVCGFSVKVKNAQLAGATAAIVANNQGDGVMTMGGADTTITIPSVFVGQATGATLRSVTGVNGTVRKSPAAPLQRDSSVDSDIVFHEYGHGLTWRMIGSMSGPISGAIGEGMSDVLAIIINDNDRVAEYSGSSDLGIRSAPYTHYPRTYGDVAGTGVHFDGEVYGAIGWQLWLNFQAAGVSKDTLLNYLVDGMNYTPAGPYYEHMRDGILQSVANAGNAHRCLVWDAFAKYGVGVGAKATLQRVKGVTKPVITQSFARPSDCP
ncbi:M36 family metallopeptidase [Pyxidicoccus xibeiensis]|uniref:M36 family metallopeptidase n=1 Tax=Pyxidicoccus xibeiensis TaxID=2906759 RepID=UPI0020A6EE1A|nr:M36 family metallopeptidase [Pyxidicoccus xibeiensis]MCP3141881.1 M36 family metallopeptidase [Pyxidicoccus xibeiensis]